MSRASTETATAKMDPKVKRKWVKALRSGKYEQGNTYLVSPDGKYCCLGVLREVVAPGVRYDNERTAQLEDEHACGLAWNKADYLANTLNDKEGKSFKEIADYIVKNL